MRLIGAQNLEEIVPETVDASSIGCHIVSVPEDGLCNSYCKSGFSLCFDLELSAFILSDVGMQHTGLIKISSTTKL